MPIIYEVMLDDEDMTVVEVMVDRQNDGTDDWSGEFYDAFRRQYPEYAEADILPEDYWPKAGHDQLFYVVHGRIDSGDVAVIGPFATKELADQYGETSVHSRDWIVTEGMWAPEAYTNS